VKISRGDIFVGPDEVAYRERKCRVLGYGKRIDAKIVLKPGHQDREAERIEAGLMKRQIIVERRQGNLLLGGNSLHLRNNP
jgi:hypothetical protein